MEINNLQSINEISEFFEALIRRKVQILLIFSTIFFSSVVISYVLPTIYESKATIVIENQEIPTNIVESTITGYLQERIEAIRRRAFTEEVLVEIAEKFDLYSEDRSEMPPRIVASLIQQNTTIETENIQAVSGKGFVPIVLALTITFEAETPEQAQGVTNELSTLFIDANNKMRIEQTSEVTVFLEEQADALKTEISELEVKLAEFKQVEQQQLPELMSVNLKLLEKTEAEINRTELNIRGYQDTIASTEAELSLTKPHQEIITDTGSRVMSANDRLSVLTAEYLRASARYSQKHPDILRLKREINALGGEGAEVGAVKELINKLTELKEKHSEALQRYSADHPDVIKYKQSILSVEKGLRNASLSAPRSTLQTAPDNPRYVTLQTQLSSARSNLSAENSRLNLLREKYSEYETRLFKTPGVEREYLTLSRDYDNAVKKYREVKDQLLEAQIGARLEIESKGEKMTLYKTAFYPFVPASPNRTAFFIIGIFLGLISGVGYAAIAEYFDRTIHGSKSITKLFDAPPIAIIPDMNDADYGKVVKMQKRAA